MSERKNKLWQLSDRFSVPMRLNIVNILVILSGLISIIGAYEIQVGGKMHELNYQHQKYITELIKSVKRFEISQQTIELVKSDINSIKQQPMDCLALAGPVEKAILELIGTGETLKICEEDLLIADRLLADIDSYEAEKMDAADLLVSLNKGIVEFSNSGIRFEPLVSRTVQITFVVVITIVIAKAIIVPLFGLLLSSSVARDYKLLSQTRMNLEDEQKRNAMIQAERMNALTTMVAGIAHEINTPVGVSVTANSHAQEIINQTEQAYLEGELTEEDLQQFFVEIKQANSIIDTNLSRTTQLVKSFKQVSVDQNADDIRNIKLKAYLDDILISLTPVIKKSAVQFHIDCSEQLTAQIYAGAFSQIITNLITNALNHAFEQQPQGEIRITVEKQQKDKIHLSFVDNGCGISEIDQVHIFDPFFTTKRNCGGSGLGLHILHNLIVDKLNGQVSCRSVVGEGTQFDISFPQNTPS